MPDPEEESPPTALVVPQRALIQCAVAYRGEIELGPTSFIESENSRLHEWLDSLDLFAAMEPGETEILRAPPGSLERPRIIAATWAIEAVAILSWALGRLELPIHDRRVDAVEIAEAIGFLDEDANSLIPDARLRSEADLRDYREFCYDAHVRLRGFLKGREPGRAPIESDYLERLGLNPERIVLQDDLAIDGRPIREIERPRVAEVEWIVGARHRAAIWLVGEFRLFTETPADT